MTNTEYPLHSGIRKQGRIFPSTGSVPSVAATVLSVLAEIFCNGAHIFMTQPRLYSKPIQ